MWFLTIDPFIRISVFIAKLSKRQNCWRVFEDLHCQEYTQFFDMNFGLFMRLHFSIGGYDYRRTARFRQSIHFIIAQVLFADHMHRRAGVDNKFSFLRFKIRCRQAPFFPKVRRMLLFHAPSLLPLCLLLWPILKFWSVGAALMRFTWANIRAKDSGLDFLAWRAVAFVNFTRWIGFCMSGLFRKIDFGGFMSWYTQPFVVHSMIGVHQVLVSTHDRYHAWHRVSPVCRDFCQGWQQVAVCFRADHSSSTWLLHFCHHSFWTIYLVVHQPGDVHITTFPQICNDSWSCRTSILEVPLFTEWLGASSFE